MLVLSRRADQKIVFPAINVTISILKVQGGVAKIGIDAPKDLRVLREELTGGSAGQAAPSLPGSTGSDRHTLRNRINGARLAVHLAQRQISIGDLKAAEETLNQATGTFQEAEALLNAMRPVKQRALLVEDDRNERKLLAAYLKSFGYEVEVAGDGIEALEYLQEADRPDVVLLDMAMPHCDGPKAVQQIRETPALHDLKVFGVSGSEPEDVGLQLGPDGVNGWFRKPLDPEQLVTRLRSETAGVGVSA